MNKVLLLLLFVVFLGGCSANKNAKSEFVKGGEVRAEDQTTVSLLNQIRRKLGILVESGIPFLASGTNSFQGSSEPLYVVDNFIVGNSFSEVEDVVNSSDVRSIEVIKSADASFYGARGGSGVIKITTKSGK